MTCPLCNAADSDAGFFRDAAREYHRCQSCGLVFVPARFHVNADEERSRYDLHDNSAANAGYVRFLTEVADVVSRRCRPGSRLLDFGCGTEAVLTKLLQDRGFRCTPYDPLYGIGGDALEPTYDAVILCEVIEHLRDLTNLPALLRRLIEPSGIVVIRTRLYPAAAEFGRWWYKNDVTHINFFCRSALGFLARETGRSVEAVAGDIFVLRPGEE